MEAVMSIGTWISCNICYRKRLASSLAQRTYRIPTIRNIARTIFYCIDDPECVKDALSRPHKKV